MHRKENLLCVVPLAEAILQVLVKTLALYCCTTTVKHHIKLYGLANVGENALSETFYGRLPMEYNFITFVYIKAGTDTEMLYGNPTMIHPVSKQSSAGHYHLTV